MAAPAGWADGERRARDARARGRRCKQCCSRRPSRSSRRDTPLDAPVALPAALLLPITLTGGARGTRCSPFSAVQCSLSLAARLERPRTQMRLLRALDNTVTYCTVLYISMHSAVYSTMRALAPPVVESSQVERSAAGAPIAQLTCRRPRRHLEWPLAEEGTHRVECGGRLASRRVSSRPPVL